MGIDRIGNAGIEGRLRGVSKKKKASGPQGFSPSKKNEGGEKVERLEGVVGVVASVEVESLDALLAVQETVSREQGRDRDVRWGFSLLEDLKLLRLSILEGEVGDEQLEGLGRKLATRDRIREDEKLDGILDDIELRVEVELAKRGGGEGGE